MNRPAVALSILVLLLLTACTSPPSVAPLLAVTERALQAETQRLAVDAERDAQWIDSTRQALAAAYDADLKAVEELTPEWVREATQVYVLAREALVRQEQALAAERAQQADNLRAAAEAVRRAAAILQQQDRLITDVVGIDLRRQLNASPSTPEQTP